MNTRWTIVIVLTVLAVIAAISVKIVSQKYRVAVLSPAELRVVKQTGLDPLYASNPTCWPKPVRNPLDAISTNVKFGTGETYKNSPVVAFQINEDGSVSNIRLERSCGVKSLDNQVLAAVSHAQYRPRPNCGILEPKITVDIDFR